MTPVDQDQMIKMMFQLVKGRCGDTSAEGHVKVAKGLGVVEERVDSAVRDLLATGNVQI